MTARHKVNIYDHANRKRLLGFIYADQLGVMRGKSWGFACMTGPVLAHYPGCPSDPTIIHVNLDIVESDERVPGTNGWGIYMALATKCPLKDLLRVDRFHLDGETDREHAIRMNSYRGY
ncbi:hypothetical protein [Mesorhizobium sp. M0767]|uniref:hypothetical protein n=1 Tax=Mesorhizobium sp. M0767 TaxID=2956995 RepID=UPI003336350B